MKKIKMKSVYISNIIRNGKHVFIDQGQEKLKQNFKTSGSTITKK
jgi:hypothetical protein